MRNPEIPHNDFEGKRQFETKKGALDSLSKLRRETVERPREDPRREPLQRLRETLPSPLPIAERSPAVRPVVSPDPRSAVVDADQVVDQNVRAPIQIEQSDLSEFQNLGDSRSNEVVSESSDAQPDTRNIS